MAYGPILAEWARIMLLASKQGGMALPLYNYLESQDLLACHLGIRAGELTLTLTLTLTNKQGPCLSAVSCTPSSHPDDYQTLLSRLDGAAIAAAILPRRPFFSTSSSRPATRRKKKQHGHWV